MIFEDYLGYDLRLNYRLFRKKWSKYFRIQKKQYFTKILYVTDRDLPKNYINALQSQYPDKRISVLMPIYGELPVSAKKTGVKLKFYLQNKNQEIEVYQLEENEFNIPVYAINTKAINSEEFWDIKYLSPFVKVARQFCRDLKFDIVHSDCIPFFLGAEFESGFIFPARVFQTCYNLSLNYEPFWAVINMADKKATLRMFKDKFVRKYIEQLFNHHGIDNLSRFNECLNSLYDNWYAYEKNIEDQEQGTKIQNLKRLNTRIRKMFSKLDFQNDYNAYKNTIKRADLIGVISKSYYDKIIKTKELSRADYKIDWIEYGLDSKIDKIYQPFDIETFRELKFNNKKYLIKEFSQDRILTKFFDNTLFVNENFKIHGYLDQFYDSPLILCEFSKTAICAVLKLFELNKNVQVIFHCTKGSNYVNQFIDFCNNNSIFDGKWVLIEGKLNYSQFASSCDIWVNDALNSRDDIHYIMLKHGAIPVVFDSGIYSSSITDIFDNMTTGCGFKSNELTDGEYEKTLVKAVNFYQHNNRSWNILIKNGMSYDSDWNFDMVEKYNSLYEEL